MSSMTYQQVLDWLEENRDPRGVAHWEKKRKPGMRLKSVGIGLTRLRQLARRIGRDHQLAQKLWKSQLYEAKVLGLLIDDPKQLTPAQAEKQVEGLSGGLLAHVFASCDATLAKAPFAFDLARQWMDSDDPVRRRCGYSLLYELSKRNPPGMDDGYLLQRIEQIQQTIHDQEMWVRESMSLALMGIGKRNRRLNQAAIRAVKKIGAIDIDYGDDNNCQPLDVLKHLTSDYLTKKLYPEK